MLLFENFNEIHKICQEYGIENYTINTDGLIDVDGDVHLYYRRLTKLPVKFRNVSGHFFCHNNKLTTLEGAPISVGGNFSCDNNNLTTLLGAPKSIDGNFWCNNNELATLEGAPQSVGGYFECSYNNLTTLVGAPQSVGGHFFCGDNRFDVIKRMFPNSKEFFNANKEWDFFAGDNKIRKLRFKEALLDYDIELPRYIKGYKYI